MRCYSVYSWSSFCNYHWKTKSYYDDSFTKNFIENDLRNKCLRQARTSINYLYKEYHNVDPNSSYTKEEFANDFINSLHIDIKEETECQQQQ